RWIRDGRRAALATVVQVERSAPRLPGSVMAVAEDGEVAGSVTGGCVEPAVYHETERVLAGEPPRMATFGIVDDEAFEVGLPCGGEVSIFVEPMDPEAVRRVAAAVAEERPLAYVTTLEGAEPGGPRIVAREGEPADAVEAAARRLLALGETGIVEVGGERV